MQRSTPLLLLSLAAVAVALGVVFAMAGESPPPDGPGAVGAEPESPSDAAARQPDPEIPPPRGAPHVHVQVRSIETFLPPPPVRVRAFDPRGRELPVAAVAGAGAWFDEGDPQPGLALVAVGIEGGGSVLRQVAVDAAGPARVDVGARLVVRGVVRDREQKPLGGASVWLGESDSTGVRREVATDDEGAFEFDVPAGSGVPFVVHAEGHASQWLPVVVTTPPREMSMSMSPSAQVAIQVVGSSHGIDAVRVFVVPGNEVSTEVAQYPFFLQALTDGTAVEANGRATLSDLPQRGAVGIVVRHPLVPADAPVQVALSSRGVRVPVPMSLAANVCTLRVVDESGAPLPGVAAWLRDRPDPVGGAPSLRLLPPALGTRGACFARSGEAGTLSLGCVAGAAALALRAPGRAGRELRWPLATDEPIVLHAWLGDECAFRLAPPKEGVAWSASSDLGSGVRATIAADRPWVVSFPGPGRFAVEITTSIDERVVATEQRVVDVTGTTDLASPRAP
ncbi:MAG: carboxypeptidase regulatory-like domain-containing protein [Planctomycetes bacterium]|nr:carboxypeptidase regulatory-like domain-containing protein [Planctomycetota bacterium]